MLVSMMSVSVQTLNKLCKEPTLALGTMCVDLNPEVKPSF